jgi:hypothetical protein
LKESQFEQAKMNRDTKVKVRQQVFGNKLITDRHDFKAIEEACEAQH